MNVSIENNQALDPIEWLKEVISEMDKHAQITEIPAHPSVDFAIELNGKKIFIETKTKVQPINVDQIEKKLNEFLSNDYCMVIANYITPKAKELLNEREISYLDQGGNISLRLPNYFLHREGLETNSEPDKYRFRAFTKTGTRVVFQLLRNPDLINAPQRELAKRAGVSLGTVPKVLQELVHNKFAVKLTERSYKLINKEELLERWVDAFNTRLLPSLFVRTFTPVGMNAHEFFKAAHMHKETLWGGEAAAAIITNYLRPEHYTLYTELTGGELMQNYKLAPKNDGEITVYQKFWEDEQFTNDHVHPILVYAELIGSGDSRNIETAKMIFNEYIRPNL